MNASGVKIGVCSWSLWQEIPEQLEFLSDHGFTATSLLQHILKADPAIRQEAASLIRERNLTLTWHSNVLNEHLIDGKIDKDYLKRLYDDVLWWHENTNGVYSSCSDANLKAINLEHVRYMAERLIPHGIRFGLENSTLPAVKEFCFKEQIREIRELSAPSPLHGMLFDAGHALVFCRLNGLDYEQYIVDLPFDIWEVHICDNLGEKDDHLPLGDGILDLPALIRGLKRKKFNGVFTLESLRKRDRAAFDLHVDIDREKVLQYRDSIMNAWNNH